MRLCADLPAKLRIWDKPLLLLKHSEPTVELNMETSRERETLYLGYVHVGFLLQTANESRQIRLQCQELLHSHLQSIVVPYIYWLFCISTMFESVRVLRTSELSVILR